MGVRRLIYNRNPGAPAYFCRFVYWMGPVFVVGFENPEGAGAGAGFCFLGFLASLLLLIWPLAIATSMIHLAIRRILPSHEFIDCEPLY